MNRRVTKQVTPGIYIAGLGDETSHGQDSAVYAWKSIGIDLHYSPVGWANGEAFEPKLRRICQQIDEYRALILLLREPKRLPYQ